MLLLVDLDGVVYRGPVPVPGVAELLARRAALGDTVIYVTNNSRWHRSEYQARLRSMGAPVTPERVVTAARATALALAERPRPPLRTMVFGGPGLARELRDAGLRTVAVTTGGLAAGPDAIAVGVDVSLSYRRLSIGAEVVRRGVFFAATNRDPVYPMDDGLKAGAGSIVAALAVAGGREPDLVVGKPEPGLFQEAARVAGIGTTEAVVIGDGLVTDIPAAHAVGARSILMLTGVSTREQVAALAPAARPTAIAADSAELARILEVMARD
jgi:HAD superfamily hydrolase (TIGR01450 family)